VLVGWKVAEVYMKLCIGEEGRKKRDGFRGGNN
jgi:hypothetical protein